MPYLNEQDDSANQPQMSEKDHQQDDQQDKPDSHGKPLSAVPDYKETPTQDTSERGQAIPLFPQEGGNQSTQTGYEGRPGERMKAPRRPGARGTAAMDPQTRKEVARKGGLAVSRNRQHMAEIGRKGGQTVSKNRDHMAQIGRKGGAASRGHR